MNKNSVILKYTGIILVVLSAAELVLEIVSVFTSDVAAVMAGNWIGQLFFFQAGNTAVQMLFSAVGLAAGYLGITMSESAGNAVSLKYAGIALIVVYLVEGLMLLGAAAPAVSWFRLAVLLTLSGLYLYAAWKE